jgi:DNA-binding transcriptional LysR family regulator
MLDAGKLATLHAVVRHGSFSAAGHALSLTQPAVSRQVALLERQVGTQLVRRTQQGVLPTEAGRLLVEHADAIIGRLALAETQLADLAGLRRGDLVVRFGDQPVGAADQLTVALRRSRIGVPLPVTVLRRGRQLVLEVTPIDQPGR